MSDKDRFIRITHLDVVVAFSWLSLAFWPHIGLSTIPKSLRLRPAGIRLLTGDQEVKSGSL